MSLQPSVLDTMRKSRTGPWAPWSLAKQDTPWTDVDKATLTSQWMNALITIEQIAAFHERSVVSCRCQANKLKLGTRPREQSFGAALKGTTKPYRPRPRRKPTGPVAVAAPAVEPEAAPVPLVQTVDGVVLTPRLDAAWARVEAGEDVATVAAELRCPTVEVLALRRWKAAA